MRDDVEHLSARIPNKDTLEKRDHSAKGIITDTMTFKGNASLSGYYKDGANTLDPRAGFAVKAILAMTVPERPRDS